MCLSFYIFCRNFLLSITFSFFLICSLYFFLFVSVLLFFLQSSFLFFLQFKCLTIPGHSTFFLTQRYTYRLGRMPSPKMATLCIWETPVITTYQTTWHRISEQCVLQEVPNKNHQISRPKVRDLPCVLNIIWNWYGAVKTIFLFISHCIVSGLRANMYACNVSVRDSMLLQHDKPELL